MAKSEGEIRMNFNKAKEEADNLTRLSKKMSEIANERFAMSVRNIGANWEGTNASAFIGKCNELNMQLLESSQNLSQIAETVRTIAKNTHDAEMSAWRIAQVRTNSE